MVKFLNLRLCLVSLLAAFAAVSVTTTGAFAGGQKVPDNVAASPDLRARIMVGDFAAKIAPARGYKGPLFVGNLAKLKLVPTLPTDLKGALAANTFVALTHFYPDDMGYYGGPVVAAADHLNVYWGESNGATWGNPASYQANLNVSLMIELLNQYTFQAKSNGHWPVSPNYWYGGSPGTLVYTSQIASTVQALATSDRANRGEPLGYNTIYHVFLPPGTDTCFDNAAQGCYNPDGAAPGPFAFCAYHTYTTLADGTVVLFTVEPYQSVNGCSAGNGVSNDTANVLGHEIAETISDPSPGTGWVGEWFANRGSEIGDECAWTIIKQKLNNVVYYTQDWYTNHYHECANIY